MINKYIVVFLLLLFNINCISQNDTIWYDSTWEKTSKNYSNYYSLKAEKKDDLFINKYFNNKGETQMSIEYSENISKFESSKFRNFVKYDTINNNSYILSGSQVDKNYEKWKLFKNNHLFVESSYKNNQKYGEWKMYYDNSIQVKLKIEYKNHQDCYSVYEVEELNESYVLPGRFRNINSHRIDGSFRITDGCLGGKYLKFKKNGEIEIDGQFSKGIPIEIWTYYGKEKNQYFNFSDYSKQEIDKIYITTIKYDENFEGTLQTPSIHFEIIANIKKYDEFYYLSYLNIDDLLMYYITNPKVDLNSLIMNLYNQLNNMKNLDLDFKDFKKEIIRKIDYFNYKN